MSKQGGPSREECSGVVLCGGQSLRMGTDKALLDWRGRSLLERACERLKPHVAAVYLSTGATPRYPELGLPCLLDSEEDLGPLGGLEAALSGVQTPWVLVLGCDLPSVSSVTLQRLFNAWKKGAQVIQFGSMAEPQPMCALYHTSLLPQVRAALGGGKRRMTSFLESSLLNGELSGATGSPICWIDDPGATSGELANVNHPQEWSRWQREQADGISQAEEAGPADQNSNGRGGSH